MNILSIMNLRPSRGLLSGLLLSMAGLAAIPAPACLAATDATVAINVDRTVNFRSNWTLSIRLQAATPAASAIPAAPTFAAGTNGSQGFLSVNTMPLLYMNPGFDPYGSRFGGLNGLVIRYSSSGNSFIAFGTQPAVLSSVSPALIISYSARKDRLTVIVGRVRKVITNVHGQLAALGITDDRAIYISDIAAKVMAGRVSAITNVQFNATAPQ
jgi:hypothetical protein